MIVEDEAIVAMDIKAELSLRGYEVCKLATSGENAIKSMEHERPDIVLMDIVLNGKTDGIMAAREIRSLYDIPIIFITGRVEEITKELAEDIAPVECISKPIEPERLGTIIEKVLRERNKELALE